MAGHPKLVSPEIKEAVSRDLQLISVKACMCYNVP